MEHLESDSPRARTRKLHIQEVGHELLVYDLESHQAHCLNPTTAFVWKLCDGTRSLSDIAALTAAHLGIEPNEDVVLAALDECAKADLMDDAEAHEARRRISRRDLLKKAGLVTVLIPTIMTITAPPAHAAASTCLSLACPGAGPSPACCATHTSCVGLKCA